MKRNTIFFICFIAAVGVFVASCNNDYEENRAVVTVASINQNAPFFSDVLEQGDTLCVNNTCPPAGSYYYADDFVREDVVEVVFNNRPYNLFTTTGPGQPLSDFLITRYRVDWRRTDGGAGVPVPYEGATSIMVPSNDIGVGYVLLVPYEAKNTALMTAINYNGAAFPDEYLMIADITFWGHEVGAQGREWSFGASLSVSFADPVVVTEENN
jgi:hypothetical protein